MSSIKTWLNEFRLEIKTNPIPKSKLVVAVFRLSTLYYNSRIPKICRIITIFFVLWNYVILDWILGVELKPRTKIGWGLIVYHANNIIIHPKTVIGRCCILRHGVTIGNKFSRRTGKETGCPIIGDEVEFGAHAVAIGEIIVGSRSVIGALALVDFSVAEDQTVVGHRGKILVKQ